MRISSLTAVALSITAACTPAFTPPRESVRVSGTVEGEVPAALEIHVYERCSPRLYFFERCPGDLLGEAKIAKPGPFLVEVDPHSAEISVVAYRGTIGQEQACAIATVAVSGLGKPVKLLLADEPCPVALPPPITASARAPVSGF